VISKLQNNVFEFLQKRNVSIHLHRNCIETLDKGAFDGSNAANVILNLMHNRIEFLPPEIFQPGRFVRIDMYNNISKIPHEFFEGDFYIELLNVDCNPLDGETVQALLRYYICRRWRHSAPQFFASKLKEMALSINPVSVTKIEVYTILRDVCIESNRFYLCHTHRIYR
jgi:hypothetical protein